MYSRRDKFRYCSPCAPLLYSYILLLHSAFSFRICSYLVYIPGNNIISGDAVSKQYGSSWVELFSFRTMIFQNFACAAGAYVRRIHWRSSLRAHNNAIFSARARKLGTEGFSVSAGCYNKYRKPRCSSAGYHIQTFKQQIDRHLQPKHRTDKNLKKLRF